jgi:predicted dehydrogenase
MVLKNANAQLVAIVEVDETLHQVLNTHFNIPVFKNIYTFFDSGIEVDVLNIATPNGYHIPLAELAIKHGHHVVVEKPLGLTTESCERLLALAKQEHRKVFCVMQNRYSPPAQWLKQILVDNRLGEIYIIQINCFWNRDERYYTPHSWRGTADQDGGPLFTQFSHFIDLMYWLFGGIEIESAVFNDFNHQQLTSHEDSGIVNFTTALGGMGSFNYTTSCNERNLESSITIIGANGSIKVGGQYMEQVTYCEIENYILPTLETTQPANDYGAYKGSASNHHFIIENVISTLHGEADETTTGDEGMRVVKIIEDIYKLRPQRLIKSL